MSIVRETKDLVRETRQALGLTLREMGELLGVTGETIRQWEMGAKEPQNTPTIQDILGMAPGPALDFWLDLSMIRHRRAKLEAAEKLQATEVVV
jgi:transcriptional regulator with XRE-family HTH domain